jgi:hypothetical protein
VLAVASGAALPAPADPVEETWRALTISSGPTEGEEPVHPEAMHEWWYFTVQNPGAAGTGCGVPWQAMATFLSDRETAKDMLLFTVVLGTKTFNLSQEFDPGTLHREDMSALGTRLTLGTSRASGFGGSWSVQARSGESLLSLQFDRGPLWRRRAPEGAGLLEITFAPRFAANGHLYMADGGVTCLVTGTGYFEHVWGNWSRVPMWGVDYLNVHLDNGWSAYARGTPMRGETNLYPALGVRPDEYWPPVLILSDGARMFEARTVDLRVSDSADTIPELSIRRPASYTVVGGDFSAPQGGSPPQSVRLEVADVTFALIPLPTTSSGILEGWGRATANIDGVAAAGTAEVEAQRYGTRYPH